MGIVNSALFHGHLGNFQLGRNYTRPLSTITTVSSFQACLSLVSCFFRSKKNDPRKRTNKTSPASCISWIVVPGKRQPQSATSLWPTFQMQPITRKTPSKMLCAGLFATCLTVRYDPGKFRKRCLVSPRQSLLLFYSR